MPCAVVRAAKDSASSRIYNVNSIFTWLQQHTQHFQVIKVASNTFHNATTTSFVLCNWPTVSSYYRFYIQHVLFNFSIHIIKYFARDQLYRYHMSKKINSVILACKERKKFSSLIRSEKCLPGKEQRFLRAKIQLYFNYIDVYALKRSLNRMPIGIRPNFNYSHG